jgi:hypothetical protein
MKLSGTAGRFTPAGIVADSDDLFRLIKMVHMITRLLILFRSDPGSIAHHCSGIFIFGKEGILHNRKMNWKELL